MYIYIYIYDRLRALRVGRDRTPLFLLTYNISPYGSFPNSEKIINVCNMYKLKRSFLILQQIIATDPATQTQQC